MLPRGAGILRPPGGGLRMTPRFYWAAVAMAAALLPGAPAARAQACPQLEGAKEAAEASLLRGKVAYHDELRPWLGLELDAPACGETEILLVFTDARGNGRRRAESLAGCRVTASGKLYSGPSGDYPVSLAMNDAALTPDASCQPRPVRRDPATVEIPDDLKAYHAAIQVDYRDRGHVAVRVWREAKNQEVLLRPAGAYVTYFFNAGGDLLWFGCRKYFHMARGVAQEPKARESIILPEEDGATSTPMIDLRGVNTVTFTCKRSDRPYEMQDNTRHADPNVPE